MLRWRNFADELRDSTENGDGSVAPHEKGEECHMHNELRIEKILGGARLEEPMICLLVWPRARARGAKVTQTDDVVKTCPRNEE